jgi:protein SCO1
MNLSPIRLSQSYVIPATQRAQLATASHIYGDAQPSPDELGGFFDFTNWRGKAISNANFIGRWTFLYFGYSRCHGSCLAVAPRIARAAKLLRERGFAAKAAFVDIESPAVGAVTRIIGNDLNDSKNHPHGNNWDKQIAMARLALKHGNDLDILTGNRFQLAQATAAFHVLREHVPPRPGEGNLSINHSSRIYLVGPDTLIAGYGYHDMSEAQMISLVEQLGGAKRSKIDLTAIRKRYIRGACGG